MDKFRYLGVILTATCEDLRKRPEHATSGNNAAECDKRRPKPKIQICKTIIRLVLMHGTQVWTPRKEDERYFGNNINENVEADPECDTRGRRYLGRNQYLAIPDVLELIKETSRTV